MKTYKETLILTNELLRTPVLVQSGNEFYTLHLKYSAESIKEVKKLLDKHDVRVLRVKDPPEL